VVGQSFRRDGLARLQFDWIDRNPPCRQRLAAFEHEIMMQRAITAVDLNDKSSGHRYDITAIGVLKTGDVKGRDE